MYLGQLVNRIIYSVCFITIDSARSMRACTYMLALFSNAYSCEIRLSSGDLYVNRIYT